MKKLFSIFAAALVASSAMAVDGVNVLPFGLKATVNDAQMTIDYSLNTAATALEVEFYDAEAEIVGLVEIDNAALLTEGAHKMTIDIPEDLEAGAYSWALNAYAGTTVFENKLTVKDPRYSFYLPQDVVVDNSFESEYFGNVYLSMPWNGEDDGGTETTQNQKRGLFVLDPTMQTVNGGDAANVGYDGGLGGATNTRNGIKRLAIDEQGFVYVASRDPETKGVYRANPADLTQPFATVLAANYAVDALEVVGEKLYTIEDIGGETGGQLNTYKLDQIPVAAATKTWELGELNLANADESLRSDRNGGFWIVQHRYAADVYPALTHLTTKGKRDFFVGGDSNPDLLSNSNGGGITQRGTMGVNVAGNLLALGSNKQAVVFAIEFDEEGVPSLTKVCETPVIGTNIDGVAFDAADNLYVACASAEQFHMYPISKAEGENHCRVFAPSKYNFEISDESAVEQVNTKVAPKKVVRNGQVLIIRNGVEYNLLGSQLK